MARQQDAVYESSEGSCSVRNQGRKRNVRSKRNRMRAGRVDHHHLADYSDKKRSSSAGPTGVEVPGGESAVTITL